LILKFFKFIKIINLISNYIFLNLLIKMGIGDWGLGIGDWGLGVGGQAPAPKPQPP
jgi:hypothetical protein